MSVSGLHEALYDPFLEDETRPPLRIPLDDKVWELTPFRGGYHVKDLDDGQCVDVVRMIFNWRVIRAINNHGAYDRGWCYSGTGPETLLIACMAAIDWDGADDTDPGYGWIKRAL